MEFLQAATATDLSTDRDPKVVETSSTTEHAGQGRIILISKRVGSNRQTLLLQSLPSILVLLGGNGILH